MLTSFALAAAYALSTALLVALCFTGNLSKRVKIGVVLFVSGFYLVSWQGYQDSLGWPTDESLPDQFRLLWVTIEEPDKSKKEPGAIAFWVRGLDEAGLAYGTPRSHRVPWSEEAADSAQNALNSLEEGELLNGRMSRDLASETEKKEGEAQDYTAGDSPEGEDGLIPDFEFFKVPPPTLPAKGI